MLILAPGVLAVWSRRPNTHRDGTQHKLRKGPPPALMSAATKRNEKKTKSGGGVRGVLLEMVQENTPGSTHSDPNTHQKVTIIAHAQELTCPLTPTSMCTPRHECITHAIIHHAEPLPWATAHSQASSSTSLCFSPSPPRPSHLPQIGCFTLYRRAFLHIFPLLWNNLFL